MGQEYALPYVRRVAYVDQTIDHRMWNLGIRTTDHRTIDHRTIDHRTIGRMDD